jgi:hypothetical protein
MSFQVTDRKAATTPRQILHRHGIDLDRAIRNLRKNAKKNQRVEVGNFVDNQYARLTDPNEPMKAEELFYDIEEQVTNGVVEFKKTAPERLEAAIDELRKASMISCQNALNALVAEKAEEAAAKVRMTEKQAKANSEVLNSAKSDRVVVSRAS